MEKASFSLSHKLRGDLIPLCGNPNTGVASNTPRAYYLTFSAVCTSPAAFFSQHLSVSLHTKMELLKAEEDRLCSAKEDLEEQLERKSSGEVTFEQTNEVLNKCKTVF